MGASDLELRVVVRLSRQEPKASFTDFLRGRKRKEPELRDGYDSYLVKWLPDGRTELRLLLPTDVRTGATVGPGASIASVCTQPSPFEVSFAAAVSDGTHDWDLVLRGSWRVERSRPFLTQYALGILSPGMSLGKEIVESWLANTVRHHVRDAVEGFSIQDLRDKDALPASWWEKHLCDWLNEYGIAVKIVEARWESATAARAEQERKRLEDLARVEQERERERQAKLREAEAEENYEREKARIEHDSRLFQAEREHQLQVLELRYRKERLAAEAEVEAARHAREKAALAHEVDMARLRNELEGLKAAEARQEEMEREHRETLERLASAHELLERLARLGEPLLQQLADRNSGKAHQAAERLASPEFRVSPQQLGVLGYPTTRQALVECFREKASADRQAVALRKAELVTRDVGTAKVKGLPINSSLRFEVITKRAGYVTLLNVGTSGTVYVHIPNAYVGVEQARVAAGRAYAVPGPELLPLEQLSRYGLEYVEIGPPGWEHMVAIVSDKPLVDSEVVARSSCEAPFMALSEDELDSVCERLGGLEAGEWSAGVLSFLVG